MKLSFRSSHEGLLDVICSPVIHEQYISEKKALVHEKILEQLTGGGQTWKKADSKKPQNEASTDGCSSRQPNLSKCSDKIVNAVKYTNAARALFSLGFPST